MNKPTAQPALRPDAFVRIPEAAHRRLKMALLQEPVRTDIRAKVAELCDAYSVPVLKANGIPVN